MNEIKIFLLISFLMAAGCATSQKVTTSKSIETYFPKSAYVVTHGGRSKDMDSHMQAAFLSHNLKISAGESEPKSMSTDLLVKYSDSWQWDISMYLQSFEITLYDKNGNLLATGQWQNSLMHSFPNEGKVVKNVVDEIFTNFPKAQAQR
jgi:hypothetical protein